MVTNGIHKLRDHNTSCPSGDAAQLALGAVLRERTADRKNRCCCVASPAYGYARAEADGVMILDEDVCGRQPCRSAAPPPNRQVRPLKLIPSSIGPNQL